MVKSYCPRMISEVLIIVAVCLSCKDFEIIKRLEISHKYPQMTFNRDDCWPVHM